jgi:hypothetical protein
MGTMRLTEPADVAAIAGAGEVTPEAQLFEIFARSARVYRQRTGGGDGSDGDSLFEPGPVFGSGRRVERMGGLLKG